MGRGKFINILLRVLQHGPEPPRPRWINQLLPDELQQGCLSWVTALHHSCYSGDLCCIALHHPSLPGATSVTSINAALQKATVALAALIPTRQGGLQARPIYQLHPDNLTLQPLVVHPPTSSEVFLDTRIGSQACPGWYSSPVPFGMALRKWAEGIFLFSPCLWLSAFFYLPLFSLKKQPYFCNPFTEKTHTAVWINTGLKIGIKTS